MPDGCEDDVRPNCAAHLASIDERLKKLDDVHTALFEKGGMKDKVAGHGKWLWLLSAVVMALLTAALAGCMPSATSPGNISTPVATAAPEITAGDVAELKVSMKQIQTTMQTNNYAMDEGRRKLEEARLAKQEARHARELQAVQEQFTMMLALLAAMLMFALAAPGPKSAQGRMILFLVGVGLVVLSILGPMFIGWLRALF